MNKQGKAYTFALVSVLCWSTVATAFKIALKYEDYVELLLLSSITSLVVLLIILMYQKHIKLLAQESTKSILKSVLLGFLNPFLYYLVLFKAYSLLPAQMAQPLNYTWGVVVVLLSIPVLKQKIKIINIIALLVSFFGVIVISTKGDVMSMKFNEPFGVFLAIGSSLIWSVYWLINMKDESDGILRLFMNFFFGTIFITFYILVFSKLEFPVTEGWLSAIYVGVFEMGITFVFWLKALNYSENTAQVSNVVYLSPFISLLFINFILGETILLSSIIGLVFIVGGIILQQFERLIKLRS